MTGEAASPPARTLGAYELLRPLARGGMADIYLARLARRGGSGPLERHVAIKVLDEARAAEPEARAMFLDEARVCALLDHENIASVLDVAVTRDGQHFLAMEYVHGVDLRKLLCAAARARYAVPFGTSLAIVAAAAAGLEYAHRKCGPDGTPLRLVHRDVSLSNIMVGHDGAVKVVDFGIASTTLQTVHTSPGVVRGKASYMSPEQCIGEQVDHRTDVFALGIVLYELTTGSRCFQGTTDFDRMLAVVRSDYIPPSRIVADYPHDLEHVVRTALANDPAQRYASAAAMIDALDRIVRSRSWTGGVAAIARMMHEVFGTVAKPWEAVPPAPVPEPTARQAPSWWRASLVRGEAHVPTLRATRFARGTHVDGIVDDELCDDEAPTRGRRPLPRRSSAPVHAA
ncbi:MAG: serine/threonine protein kinase [Deltaproteobacteria bacterium]|nr:serine/threonine protein kinase [Deltaproteobacteria bacterium]MDQ3301066.1 serine/threonine protein kinase [Myxococcota bacterium]